MQPKRHSRRAWTTCRNVSRRPSERREASTVSSVRRTKRLGREDQPEVLGQLAGASPEPAYAVVAVADLAAHRRSRRGLSSERGGGDLDGVEVVEGERADHLAHRSCRCPGPGTPAPNQDPVSPVRVTRKSEVSSAWVPTSTPSLPDAEVRGPTPAGENVGAGAPVVLRDVAGQLLGGCVGPRDGERHLVRRGGCRARRARTAATRSSSVMPRSSSGPSRRRSPSIGSRSRRWSCSGDDPATQHDRALGRAQHAEILERVARRRPRSRRARPRRGWRSSRATPGPARRRRPGRSPRACPRSASASDLAGDVAVPGARRRRRSRRQIATPAS